MAISFGSSNLTSIYFGTNLIQEVYFGTNKVWPVGGFIGVVINSGTEAYVSDNEVDITAQAILNVNADGSITVGGDNTTNISDGWYSPFTTGIGNSYWVKATTVSGSGSTGTIGSWLALSSSRQWVRSASPAFGGNTQTWKINLQFATDSAGVNVVGSYNVTLYATSTKTGGTVGTVNTYVP